MPYRVSSSTFIHPLSYDNLIERRWEISFVLSGCKYRINSINEEIFYIFLLIFFCNRLHRFYYQLIKKKQAQHFMRWTCPKC